MLYPDNNSLFDYYNTDNYYKQSINKIYIKAFKCLCELLSKYSKVIIIERHDEVLSYINYGDIVYNYDMHHDIMYDDTDYRFLDPNIYKYTESSFKEATWAGYAIKNLGIKYTWFRHEDSYTDYYLNQFNYEECFDLIIPQADLVFVVKSPNYLTPKQFDYINKLLEVTIGQRVS